MEVPKRVPTGPRWWWPMVVVLVVTGGFVFYSFVGTLVLGLFAYYLARPFARIVEGYVDSRAVAGATALLFLVLPFVVVLSGLVLVAAAELATLSAEPVGTILEVLFPNADRSQLPSDPVGLLASFVDPTGERSIENALVGAFSTGVVANALFHASISLLVAFVLLRDGRRLRAWFRREFAPEDTTLGRYLVAVDRDLHGVYFGTTVTVFVVISLSFVVYLGLNAIAPPGLEIPSPLLLATATGVASLVPLIGRNSVYLTLTAWLGSTALTTDPRALWFPLLYLVLMNGVFDTVIGSTLRPHASEATIRPGLTLLALTLGTVLFGWYGVFYGPLLLAVNAEFVRLGLPHLLRGETRSPVGGGDTAEAESLDTREDDSPDDFERPG